MWTGRPTRWRSEAARVFRNLVELDAENPVRLRFATDAQELFIEWLAELEAKRQGEAETGDGTGNEEGDAGADVT